MSEARALLEEARRRNPASLEANMLLGETLVAIGEAYPELKASEGFLKLQDELVDIEEKISYARHFYNRNVLAYNTRTAVFPSRLVAGLFGFRSADFFEAEEDARLAVALPLGDP